MSTAGPVTNMNHDKSVFSPVFVPQEDYSPCKILTWGVFSKHLEIVRDSSKSIGDKILHGVLAAIEFLPIISQIASLIEAIASKIWGWCNSDGVGQKSNAVKQLGATLSNLESKFNVCYEYLVNNLGPDRKISESDVINYRTSMQNVYQDLQKSEVDLKEYELQLSQVDELLMYRYDVLSLQSIKDKTLPPSYPEAKSFGWVSKSEIKDSLGTYIRPSYADLQSLVHGVFKKSEFESIYVFDIGDNIKGSANEKIPRGSLIQVKPTSQDFIFPNELYQKLRNEALSKGYAGVEPMAQKVGVARNQWTFLLPYSELSP